MIYDDFKLPDIALYLQDYIDITYVMQKTVFPRIAWYSILGLNQKRTVKFTGVYDEYKEYLDMLLWTVGMTFHSLALPKTESQRRAVYFLCHAAEQMECFKQPHQYDLRTPNRIDISMFSGLPIDREEKAKTTIKILFSINEYGSMIYNPEIIQQNHFVVFRDNREKFNVRQEAKLDQSTPKR